MSSIGRSISHLGRSTPAPKNKRKGPAADDDFANKEGKSPDTRAASNFATPAPTPVDVRRAAMAAPDPKGRRDAPFGIAVPNKPGFVTSPYAPTRGYVDVRGFPSGTEVKDPYTNKVFLAP